MLVQCENCGNHYDDSSQSVKCEGAGRKGHAVIRPTAVSSHVYHTRKALGRPPVNDGIMDPARWDLDPA